MSLSQDQVVEYIKNLKLGEVKNLLSVLETELGVSASAPIGTVMPLDVGEKLGMSQTEFDVVLGSFEADKKINVIKVVRELTGLGLKEAKTLVETPGAKVKEGIGKPEADTVVATLLAAGAQAEIK